MIWFDNDPHKNINEKIRLAVQYYQSKFGSQPTLCFLHPKLREKFLESESDVEVEFNLALSPDHIWVGIRHQLA